MKTANFIKTNLKASALLLFATAMTCGFTSCDNDLEAVDRQSKEAPAEEPHSIAIDRYDDLAILLNTLAETDATGRVTNRYYGEPLDANDPMHLYIGVDELQEAKDMFMLWLAPDVRMNEHADGSLTAVLTDELGKTQGTLRFTPSTEENHMAEVTTDIKQTHFNRITFLDNAAWPAGNCFEASPRYCKFDIVYHVKLKDITEHLKSDDLDLNFVCIQGSSNGVKPIFCAVTHTRYITPMLKKYSNQIRISRYTPGSGTYPTAANIQTLLLKDWSYYLDAFSKAGCGPMIAGTEYWYDYVNDNFFRTYYGVMDYHSGFTYGEHKDKEYYFLFRMYGLDDSQIYDGMSF